jgi:hypothetical protein
MGTAVMEPVKVAKAKGRPGSGRSEVPVKLDKALASMVKAVATAKGLTVGEYLSGLTSALIHRDYARMLREVEKKGADS